MIVQQSSKLRIFPNDFDIPCEMGLEELCLDMICDEQ